MNVNRFQPSQLTFADVQEYCRTHPVTFTTSHRTAAEDVRNKSNRINNSRELLDELNKAIIKLNEYQRLYEIRQYLDDVFTPNYYVKVNGEMYGPYKPQDKTAANKLKKRLQRYLNSESNPQKNKLIKEV